MLDKLQKGEIIDLLIHTIKVICGDDEKHLKDITHTIVCHAQCTEIMAEKGRLEDYEEPHRKELFGLLLTNYLVSRYVPTGKGLDDKTISTFYADYNKSKLGFLEWVRTFPCP